MLEERCLQHNCLSKSHPSCFDPGFTYRDVAGIDIVRARVIIHVGQLHSRGIIWKEVYWERCISEPWGDFSTVYRMLCIWHVLALTPTTTPHGRQSQLHFAGEAHTELHKWPRNIQANEPNALLSPSVLPSVTLTTFVWWSGQLLFILVMNTIQKSYLQLLHPIG